MEFLSSLHPVFVHFPIAVFLLYIIFEMLGIFDDNFSKAALVLLLFGVLTGLAAVLTGNQAAEVLLKSSQIGKNIPKELIESHENYATLTLWFFFALAVLRIYLVVKKKFNKKMKIIILFLAILGYIFVFETGERGGKLVYDFGAGTRIIHKIDNNK